MRDLSEITASMVYCGAMRFLPTALLALAIAMSVTAPAHAEKGGNGKGNSVSAEKSNNGGGNQGNGGGSTNAGNGNAGGNGNGNGNGNGAGPAEPAVVVPVPDDQQVVRDAVRARAALSLDAITAVVADDTDGRILDVQLVTFKGIYLYDVTVLERDGVLHKLYYNARSGARVRTD
jgi:hypothetical protein